MDESQASNFSKRSFRDHPIIHIQSLDRSCPCRGSNNSTSISSAVRFHPPRPPLSSQKIRDPRIRGILDQFDESRTRSKGGTSSLYQFYKRYLSPRVKKETNARKKTNSCEIPCRSPQCALLASKRRNRSRTKATGTAVRGDSGSSDRCSARLLG